MTSRCPSLCVISKYRIYMQYIKFLLILYSTRLPLFICTRTTTSKTCIVTFYKIVVQSSLSLCLLLLIRVVIKWSIFYKLRITFSTIYFITAFRSSQICNFQELLDIIRSVGIKQYCKLHVTISQWTTSGFK